MMERAPPSPSSPTPTPTPPRKRRKRGDGSSSRPLENEFLPGPGDAADEVEEGAARGSLNFHELLDEDALRHKFTVVNRAPVMMAWACVVAERLGFSRDEALSIGT